MSVVTYPGLPNEVLSAPELAAIDKAVGWPQQDIAQAVAIEENQSEGGNTDAWNPTDPDGGSIGEFQINGVHGPGNYLTPAFAKDMADPIANSREALGLFAGQGWQPWTGDPSLSGSHQNLGAGEQAAQVVAPYSQGQIQAVLTSATSTKGGGHKVPGWLVPIADPTGAASHAIGNAAASAVTSAAKSGAGGIGNSIWPYLAKGIGAVAGLGLIVLALKEAGGSNKQADQGSALKHAAEVAAA